MNQNLNLDDLDFIDLNLDDLESVVGGQMCTHSPATAIPATAIPATAIPATATPATATPGGTPTNVNGIGLADIPLIEAGNIAAGLGIPFF